MEDEDESASVTLNNIGGVFIIIFTGIVIASFISGIEYFYYKYYKGPTPTAGSVSPVKVVEKQVY